MRLAVHGVDRDGLAEDVSFERKLRKRVQREFDHRFPIPIHLFPGKERDRDHAGEHVLQKRTRILLAVRWRMFPKPTHCVELGNIVFQIEKPLGAGSVRHPFEVVKQCKLRRLGF